MQGLPSILSLFHNELINSIIHTYEFQSAITGNKVLNYYMPAVQRIIMAQLTTVYGIT